MSKKDLLPQQREKLLITLHSRFKQHMDRHKNLEWDEVLIKLNANENKLWSLHEMEITGGEPDVIGYSEDMNEFIFFDCSPESPKGRRSLCYDRDALESRKKFKPKNSTLDVAADMGIELLSEKEYTDLQQLGNFDTKTSSWLKTPDDIRSLGGAIFGDFRFGRVFIYHNGAESYYASRGFRGSLSI